jgi:hypothetical protein
MGEHSNLSRIRHFLSGAVCGMQGLEQAAELVPYVEELVSDWSMAEHLPENVNEIRAILIEVRQLLPGGDRECPLPKVLSPEDFYTSGLEALLSEAARRPGGGVWQPTRYESPIASSIALGEALAEARQGYQNDPDVSAFKSVVRGALKWALGRLEDKPAGKPLRVGGLAGASVMDAEDLVAGESAACAAAPPADGVTVPSSVGGECF